MNADEIVRLLDDLAARLEGPARYTFELVVRQVFLEGVIWSVAATVGLVVAILGVPWLFRWYKYGGEGYSNMRDIPATLGVVTLLVIAGACVLLFGKSALLLLNPEYAALERIAGLLVP